MFPNLSLIFWFLAVFFSGYSLATGQVAPLAIGLLSAVFGMVSERQ